LCDHRFRAELADLIDIDAMLDMGCSTWGGIGGDCVLTADGAKSMGR
jgi:hypothetical protein